MRWNRHDGNSSPGHVKKLHAVAGFLAGNFMAFDKRADISCTQALMWKIDGENHIVVKLEFHWITLNTL